MPEITGTWTFNGSCSAQIVESGNTPYQTYFALPSGNIEGTRVSKFLSYADANTNGIYDNGDLLIGETLVQSFGSKGGSIGTFRSAAGSNIVESYIGDVLVGRATSQAGNPWGEGVSSSASTGDIAPETATTAFPENQQSVINGEKDIFRFDTTPDGQIDRVMGFRSKDGDTLSISRSAFSIDAGRLAIAKNSKALSKQLGSDVDIVYYRKSGELILNANGSEPGFGDNGGAFALLAGRPVLNLGSVEFF